MTKYHVIIPCAGHGSRFGSELPKQYHDLAGKTVLDWTLLAFSSVEYITSITVVCSPNDFYIDDYKIRFPNIVFANVGGYSRAESVANGLNSLNADPNDWILVHDAARCCIDPRDISKMIESLYFDIVGGILAIPATDTIKKVNPQTSLVESTIDRTTIYQAQTPQMFRSFILSVALDGNLESITDEASAIERLGYPIRIVKANYPNFKITYQQDMDLAEYVLLKRQQIRM